MRRKLLQACLLVAATASALAQDGSDVERLAKELGQDPIALLRRIGSKATPDEADALARTWRTRLGDDANRQVRLLRLGLGHADERVVFGAVILTDRPMLLPEVRVAAARTVPRVGAPDCPLTYEHVLDEIASVDVPATAAALQRLPELDASRWLGHLHRQSRVEHVPMLCALAVATRGEVRRAAFENAAMVVEYSERHAPLLLATWLTCVGRTADPDGDGERLPGALTATLRASLELPDEPQPAEPRPEPPEPGARPEPRRPRFPAIQCMRWLLTCRAAPSDAALLRRVVTEGRTELRHAALQVLATSADEDARRFVREVPFADYPELPVRIARARAGDVTELDRLFAGGRDELAGALAAASPGRRREFAALLLSAPAGDAVQLLDRLHDATSGEPQWFAVPPYDDAWLADLEPATAAAAAKLDARVLRRIVAVVPGCATQRLADALLARPAQELFAADPEEWDVESNPRGDLGFAGVWAFLEATRVTALRDRLHEGVRGDDDSIHAVCAKLLVQLGDTTELERLLPWLDDDDAYRERWLAFARGVAPAAATSKVVDALRTRLLAAEAHAALPFVRALALALGMPPEVAMRWEPTNEQVAAARPELARGDAVAAFLAAAALEAPDERLRSWLGAWREPRIETWLRTPRAPAEGEDADDATTLARHALERGILAGDAPSRAVLAEMLRDGRYVTHHEPDADLKARVLGIEHLPFWIDELATNCCRASPVEEVLEVLFRSDPHTFDAASRAEPAASRLRRRLLPLQHRLRWSRIANAYVVAGA